jgi:hypothetical protein
MKTPLLLLELRLKLPYIAQDPTIFVLVLAFY